MEETINNFTDLEKYLNDTNYHFCMHDSRIIDMTIDESSIVTKVLFGEIIYLSYKSLFENVWKDPRNASIIMRLTYYKPKIISNNIDMSDIAGSSFIENHDINHRVMFDIASDVTDFDNDKEYFLEFEYETCKWEILDIGDFDYYYYSKRKL
ncbi:MAG: hypothetical protein RSD04_02700 [Clostridia bacterium]